MGAELFHARGQTDGRTDKTKFIVAFRNFANAPKNPRPLRLNLIFIHDQLSIWFYALELLLVKVAPHYTLKAIHLKF